MRKFIICALLLVSALDFIIACGKRNDMKTADPYDLVGKWIEQSSLKDTIEFRILNSDLKSFQLSVMRMAGGAPVYSNVGIFRYNPFPDTIALNNMISSISGFYNYYFRMNTAKTSFEIGNFYKADQPATRLTFQKM